MDDSRILDLLNKCDDVQIVATRDAIALLQVEAIATLAEQLSQVGRLIEELLEPTPTLWQRVKYRTYRRMRKI